MEEQNPEAAAYLLHSNFISQMELNSSNNIDQRKSLSMAQDRRYSQIYERMERSVKIDASECSKTYLD